MAMGPGMFYTEYKDYTLKQLLDLYVEAIMYSTSEKIQLEEEKAILAGLDDVSPITDNESKIQALLQLIDEKRGYKKSLSIVEELSEINENNIEKEGLEGGPTLG